MPWSRVKAIRPCEVVDALPLQPLELLREVPDPVGQAVGQAGLAETAVAPLAPNAIGPASRTATRRDGSVSVRAIAVHRPVKPAPTIATSTSRCSPGPAADRRSGRRRGQWDRWGRGVADVGARQRRRHAMTIGRVMLAVPPREAGGGRGGIDRLDEVRDQYQLGPAIRSPRRDWGIRGARRHRHGAATFDPQPKPWTGRDQPSRSSWSDECRVDEP